ncbi:MAG: hypothetical protein GF329_00435 [Candidatus Lokiarchaeota archaeon]|nr:hypothetical protein [Candidatus Lokiarchaeota archaeon]
MNKKRKITVLVAILGIFSGIFLFIIGIEQPKLEVSTQFIRHSPEDNGFRIKVEQNLTTIDNGTNLKQGLFIDPGYELIQECEFVFKFWRLYEEGMLPKYIPIEFFKNKITLQ